MQEGYSTALRVLFYSASEVSFGEDREQGVSKSVHVSFNTRMTILLLRLISGE